MTPGLIVAGAIGVAGGALVVTGRLAARPDPVRRGLGAAALPPRSSLLDRALDRWDARVGMGKQRDSLRLLGASPEQHRRHQLLFVGLAAGFAALVGWMNSGPSAALFLAAVGATAGLLAAESNLHRRATGRRAVLARQVLAVTQTMALSVSAGETAAEAIARAASLAPEPISRWLGDVDAEIRSGRSMEAALGDAADAMAVSDFSLLADSLVAASMRGAPLATTLLEQVRDTRARQRAAALERAGRSDIAMLLPVVFLVLPAVVLVALFPGFVALSSM